MQTSSIKVTFILLTMVCSYCSIAQLNMFYTANSTLMTPQQKGEVVLTVTNTLQSTTQLASSITYRPLKYLSVTANVMNNDITLDGGLGIGTVFRIDSVAKSGGWYFDGYTGMHFTRSDFFTLDVFSNSYYGQLGAHMQYRAFTLSFIAKLYVADITRLAIEDLESNQFLLDEISANDPFVYPETKTRISLSNRGITAFAQISNLYFKDSFLIDDRVRLSLGVSINIQDAIGAVRDDLKKIIQ